MERFKEFDVTGRLRVAREGYNGTLTGSFKGIRDFTASLATHDSVPILSLRVSPSSSILNGR